MLRCTMSPFCTNCQVFLARAQRDVQDTICTRVKHARTYWLSSREYAFSRYINGTSEGHITVKDLDACFINDFRASEWAPQTNFSSCLLCKLMVNPSALDVSFLDCMWLQKKYLRDGIAPGIVYLSPPLLKPSTQNTSPTLPVAVGADIREDASVPVSAVYSLAVISPNGRQILMFYSNLIANHSRQIALPTELSGISSLWYC
jgi:hypothetical protein